ncbi:MAG: M14 family metallopeptidase, partial [Salinibacter sp.]
MTDHSLPIVAFVALVGVLIPPAAPAQSSDAGPELAEQKLYGSPCPAYTPDYTFDCYHDYQEVTAFLKKAAEAHPDLASLQSLGTSYQGRKIWMMTLTNPATGSPSSKPALWVDGGIDADEVVSVEVALGLIHRLLASDSDRIRRLLRTRTFYVVPMAVPDANQIHYRTPIRPRDVSLRPRDEDGDGRKDEDPPEDLDGDGEILTMRHQTPDGHLVRDTTDRRLLRERKPGDECPCYEVYLEGIDNDGDGKYQEDRYGGIDPNRNYPGNWAPGGAGGPFPGSEPSVRAMLDFIAFHPEIAASQHLHSTGGVILHPPSVKRLTLPEEDRELYLELSRRGLEITGYDLATSVYDWNWPPGSSNRKSGQVWRDAEGTLHGGSTYPAPGGSIDGMYLNFGILAFANEIYSMGTDYDGDGTITEAEQLRYNDEEMDGSAFRSYQSYEHRELGTVQIGGWRKFGRSNPPPAELPAEVRKN